MYQLDEKIMAEDRAIIAISRDKQHIDSDLRPGMIAFEHEKKDAYFVISKDILHRIIKEEEDSKVHGSVVFADDVIIENNLIVQGETTKVETVDLLVSDNIIEINKDETGAGITKGQAGILINRGTEEAYYTIFSETTDRANLQGFMHVIGADVIHTIFSNGDMKTKGDIDTQNIFAHEHIIIDKDLHTKGNTVVDGTLAVGGESTLNGATHVDSTLTVANETTIGGSFVAMDTSTFKGESTFEADITANTNVTIQQDLTVEGATTINGQTTMNDLATLHSLSVLNDTTLNGGLTVKGESVFEDISTFKEAVVYEKGLTTGGATSLNALTVITTSRFHGNSKFDDDVKIDGGLTLDGSTIFNGSSEFRAPLTAVEDVTLEKNLSALNGESVFKAVGINENLNVLGTVVTSNTRTGLFNASEVANFDKDVTMKEDLIVEGNISCANEIETESLVVKNGATIEADTNFDGDANFKNNVNVAKNLNVAETAIAKNLTVDNTLAFSALNKGQMFYQAYLETTSLFKEAADSVALKLDTGVTYKQFSNNILLTELRNDCFRSAVPIQVKSGVRWGTVLDDVTGHKALHSIGGSDELFPVDIGAVENQFGLRMIAKGLDANKGVPHADGAMYIATDTRTIYASVDNQWERMTAATWNDLTEKPSNFTPVIATKSRLGGIKVGKNLAIEDDGTLSVPNVSVEYTIHRKEFITQTANVDTFQTDIDFITGCNLVSVYVFGKLLPPSAYTEVDERTIRLNQPVALNTHVEIIVLSVPSKAMFAFKREEFYAKDYQKRFTLIRGQYLVGEDKLKVYLFGALLPKSAYTEINETTIELKNGLSAGDHITIEYMSAPEVTSRLRTGTSSVVTGYTARSQQNMFEFAEPAEVWTINHGTSSYPMVTAIAYNGLKLEPIGTVYQDQNTIHLTFNQPVSGRAFIK